MPTMPDPGHQSGDRRRPRGAETAGRSRAQGDARSVVGGKERTLGAGAAEPSADWPWHGRSASFPASLDRYAGLTGPATKGHPESTRGGPPSGTPDPCVAPCARSFTHSAVRSLSCSIAPSARTPPTADSSVAFWGARSVRCSLRLSLTHSAVRSLPCSLPPSARAPQRPILGSAGQRTRSDPTPPWRSMSTRLAAAA